MTVSVLIVDDHPVVRTGLRAVIDANERTKAVGEAATGEEAIQLAEHLRPDVVLCDLRLGEGMDGIATTRALRSLDAAPAVLILTTFDRDAEVMGALEAGAGGYLLKDVAPDAIVEALVTVAGGGTYLPQELASRVLTGIRKPLPRLTARETDVLRLLATGISNREIAKRLYVSEATVKSHLVHIFAKLGADNRARAVHVARESGLL
ncbi:MAG TPA: response regulator transcription factor [Candidatus Agrococcus pullicola]|uniref:Response regulator transcription factor n=1 Tax=Candidatus Agrococcus pullicola TaxID=2838429 RepID=A0A9D2C9B8_9MICO|nr:response regulator transcription factor [Candidatus Agrococcus pullicola]